MEFVGRGIELWRYPCKSLAGERASSIQVTQKGVLGDRLYALVDFETGDIATAKHARFAPLLNVKALFMREPTLEDPTPPVIFIFPSGKRVRSDSDDCDRVFSEFIGRELRLVSRNTSPVFRKTAAGFETSEGTFLDSSSLHLITAGTLRQLQRFYPAGDFDIRRFRPNILVQSLAPFGFVENWWVGRQVVAGEATLSITGMCERCVMVTLPQQSLSKDPEILRAVVQHNDGNAGVRAEIIREGAILQYDALSLV